jgi:hypothetical protein
MYLTTANAQEVNYGLIMGTWEYKSPKGKSKLSYKFDVDKKFISLLERNETELKTQGSYELDKKGDLDRLKLTPTEAGNSKHSQIIYHLIKAIGPDTVKLQLVNDKQTIWSGENRRNTMVFVRKKEKPKSEK